MSSSIKSLFQPDHDHYDGVRPINIYLMRLLYLLMIVFVGKDSWTYILTHHGAWDPKEAMVWSVWAAFATLAVLGFFRPVKMLPILFLEIFYKTLWLILVAYPLWKAGTLVASAAAGMTVVVPWGYVYKTYVINAKKQGAGPNT
jgi:hypothetical protein